MLTPVQIGMMLLDKHAPGWIEKIDIDNLDLTSCQQCVLGQVFGNYVEGIVALNIQEPGGTPYGFNAQNPVRYNKFDPAFIALQEQWLQAIEERKGGRVKNEGRVELREAVTV